MLLLENIHNEYDVNVMIATMQQPETVQVRCPDCDDDLAHHARQWLGFGHGWTSQGIYVCLQLRKSSVVDCMREHIFPQKIQLGHGDAAVVYDAIAVIHHHGESVCSGHYLTYGVDRSGRWWRVDDQTVTSATWGRFNPYIVIYRRSAQASENVELFAAPVLGRTPSIPWNI